MIFIYWGLYQGWWGSGERLVEGWWGSGERLVTISPAFSFGNHLLSYEKKIFGPAVNGFDKLRFMFCRVDLAQLYDCLCYQSEQIYASQLSIFN